jgi:hypothetical protein
MVFAPDDGGCKPSALQLKRRPVKTKYWPSQSEINSTKQFSSRSKQTTKMPSAVSLTAEYSARDSESKAFTQTLPPGSKEPSAAERTASLTALRSAITDTQDQINAFLTQKMDEDNKKAGAHATFDDAKAEELYGEETVEED